MQSVSIFFFKFIHPCFLLYLLLFIRPSFYVLSGYFYVAVNLVAVPSVWIRDTVHLRVLKCLSPRPHRTYPFVFENEDFFPLVWPIVHPCRGKRSAETHLFKSLSRAKIFENAVGWTRVDAGKTNTSRCWIQDPTPRTRWDEMPMLQSKKVPLSVTTAFSFGREKNNSKTQSEKKSGGKNLHFQTKTDTCERGLTW